MDGSTYRFALSGVPLPEGEDPLGIWTLPETEGVSFSATVGAPEEPTWRIDLPASSEEAQQLLQQQARALTLSGEDLKRAQQALAELRKEEVSFSPTDPLAVPKSTLLETLNALSTPVSYGIAVQEDEEMQQAYRQWSTFMAQVRQTLVHYARIETSMAGNPAGMTEVSWTGDFKTTYPSGAPASAIHYHAQAVHLALGSRIALMRIISIVAVGATGLAIKAAVPGAQVLLLPATWKFVRDVLKELRKSWPQIQSLL